MGRAFIIENRLNWIDWSKVIAISFVVFGHIPDEKGSFVRNYIIQFHMPLFFFISGYLTKKAFYSIPTIRKYWHTLIIPYLCFNIIFYPYWIVRHIIDYPQAEIFDFIKPLIGTLLLQLQTPISESLNGVTWFISALLIMKITLSICNHYKHGILMMIILSIIFSLIYLVNEYYRFFTDWPLVGFTKCFPFFFIGHFIKKKNIISEKQMRNDWHICIGGILISIFAYSYERITSGIYTYSICFWVICLSAIMGFISLCKLLDNIYLPVIDNISIGTIVIMGLHWMLIGFTNYMLCKLLMINTIAYPLWVAILLTILYIALLYPVIILFKNKYPFMLGKRIK